MPKRFLLILYMLLHPLSVCDMMCVQHLLL
nr:MAG TPA: Metal dependent phosphohydrolase, PROKARYOTIC IMMUNE SYSTEM, HD-MOTIF.3A [Caudoviricetes sp.]